MWCASKPFNTTNLTSALQAICLLHAYSSIKSVAYGSTNRARTVTYTNHIYVISSRWKLPTTQQDILQPPPSLSTTSPSNFMPTIHRSMTTISEDASRISTTPMCVRMCVRMRVYVCVCGLFEIISHQSMDFSDSNYWCPRPEVK